MVYLQRKLLPHSYSSPHSPEWGQGDYGTDLNHPGPALPRYLPAAPGLHQPLPHPGIPHPGAAPVYKTKPEDIVLAQISNLRYRILLIRNMQAYGIAGFFLCVLCMFLLFFGQVFLGKLSFGLSLILLMISLGISLREIQVSIDALNYRLSDLEGSNPAPP